MASTLAVPGLVTVGGGVPSCRASNASVSFHGILLGRSKVRSSCRSSGCSSVAGNKEKKNRLKCRAGAGLEEIAPATAAVYGLTLLSGGLVAYSRTGSKGSLVGGLTGGLAFAVAFLLMMNPETKDIANAIGFGAASLFIAVFGIRLAATRKPLPSGLLLAISIAASVVFVNAYFNARLP